MLNGNPGHKNEEMFESNKLNLTNKRAKRVVKVFGTPAQILTQNVF